MSIARGLAGEIARGLGDEIALSSGQTVFGVSR